jgi:hypothetical protein
LLIVAVVGLIDLAVGSGALVGVVGLNALVGVVGLFDLVGLGGLDGSGWVEK